MCFPIAIKQLVAGLHINTDNRYQIDATFGYQGSYKFNNENRWGLSPTVSLAWYVSNEKFFDVLKPAISNLKIRGSIGKINNDRAVSAYMYMSRLQNLNEGIYFGNDMVQYTSLLETQQANPSATYEESTQMNLGADLGMFSNRLNATSTFGRIVAPVYTPFPPHFHPCWDILLSICQARISEKWKPKVGKPA